MHGMKKGADMRRKRQSAPAVPSDYISAWLRLFSRSPAEIEAERASRQPSPPPQPAGSRKGAIPASGRTLAAPARQVYPKGKERME